MAEKIKIVSDPYARSITFQSLDGGEWHPINRETSATSGLIAKSISESFLPFKAQEIIDLILREFAVPGQRLGIVFEGSHDEWDEVLAVCASEEFASRVEAERSERWLPDAADVLPEIVRIFDDVSPLVGSSALEREDVRRDLDKFLDASSDRIPICVLGNYSAGKSTFINALIGAELLPSADAPTTARLFQIRRSHDRDRGSVEFVHGGRRVAIRFGEETEEGLPSSEGSEFAKGLAGALALVKGRPMVERMRSTLEFLNAYESDEADEALSDLIEVCVPFGGEDAWGASNEFVIFDSPGSNSVSNEEHSLVLKRAMEGMSNGLPVYVVTYDSLDTTDNQDLYEQIEQIDAIDERFAMIVVNKADLTTLPIEGMTEELRSRIRQSAVYQSMYAMGIYFVASIAGLGAKTGGTFLDESYEERYESCKAKYGDPENKYYRALYRYDILPGQAATRVIEESGDCEDLVLANSGLYCVEREIERFATRYAAYNKCHQSEGLLGRLIDITREETTRKKHGHERSMRTYTRQLNRGEAALVSSIDASETKLRRQALESYEDEMDRALGPALPTFDVRDLEVLESRFTERRRDELEYDQEREDIGEALRDALDNVRDRFAGGEGLIDAVASAVRGVGEDMAVARDEVRDFLQAKQEADRLAASDIIEAVQSRYDDELGGFASRVADASESYWKKRAEAIRDELYGIATNCAELSEDRRRELGELIVQYAPLTLGAGNGIFERGDFRFWPLFRMVHPLNVERLDLAKVSRTYRDEMATAAANIRQDVGNSHGARFVEWVDELMAVIRENITEYNPDLREKVESIRFEESSISQLESALSSLGTAVDRVRRLLAWRG